MKSSSSGVQQVEKFDCTVISVPQKGSYCFLKAKGFPYPLLGISKHFKYPQNPILLDLLGHSGTCTIEQNQNPEKGYIATNIELSSSVSKKERVR